jgi:hypothetical protein
MVRVVVGQVGEGYFAERVHLIKVQMQLVHFGPGGGFVGKAFQKANGDFVLDSPPVGFPGRAKEQYPSWAFSPHLLL